MTRLLPWILLALAAPAAAQEINDAASLVVAPAKVALGPGVKVGYSVTQVFRGGGVEQVNHYAVVGEDAEAFRVEHVGPAITSLATTLPELRGTRMGLVVRKADGVVTEAWLGKPGEALQAITIAPPRPAGEEPQVEETELQLAFGKVPATAHKGQAKTQWMGREGELAGVLLKEQRGPFSYALTAPPVAGERTLSGVTLKTKTLTYDDGQVMVLAADPVLEAFFGTGAGALLEVRTPLLQVRVTERRTDARPQLLWD